MSRTILSVCCSLLFLGAVACEGKNKSAERADEAKAKAPAEPVPGEAKKPAEVEPQVATGGDGVLALPALPAAAEGKAWFVVREEGVVGFDGKSFAPVKAIPERERKYVNKLVRGEGGVVYVVATSKIWNLEGDKASELPDEGKPLLAGELVPGPGGTVWLWSITQLGRFDGKAWTVLKADELEKGGSYHGLAVDGAGTAWLATHKKLYKRDGEAWTAVDVPGLDGGLFSAMTASSKGVVYAVTSHGLVAIDGGKPTLYKMPKARDGFGVKLAVPGPDGEIALVTNDSDVTVYRPGEGGGFAIYSRGAVNLGYAHDAAVDGQGRVWVAADNGLAVFDRAGQLTTYGPGTVAALNAGVKSVLVDGAGPALPVIGEIERGTVKGQVLAKGGKAVEGARVTICASPRMMFRQGETPCAAQPHEQEAKTDAEGRFVFEGVPLGTWGFAVLVPGEKKWSISFRDYCKDMKKGETCNAPLVLD